MKTSPQAELPVKLARARRSFEKWRSTHKLRSRLPEHLWSLAVESAREYGLHRTARALRLDYNGLKKRTEFPVPGKSSPAAPAGNRHAKQPAEQFLELLPAGTNPVIECTIECESARGDRIRIHLQGRELPELAALSRELWRGRQ